MTTETTGQDEKIGYPESGISPAAEADRAPAAETISPARAACEAFWAAVGAGPAVQAPTAAWDWAFSQNTTRAWEAAAKAASRTAEHERDQARADLAKAGELIRRLERITTAWTRGMYSARIDILRGDTKAAIECLSEGLDGYDGTEWDGTETGAEWWERTKAEEGLEHECIEGCCG